MPRPKRTYLRLASFFASQPPGVNRLSLTIDEIEEVVGEQLPPHSKFPFWWHNEAENVHSRAWLTAGWRVAEMIKTEKRVVFERSRSILEP